MPPVILLIIAFGVGAHVQNRRRNAQPQVRIDQGMPVWVRQDVVNALQFEADPNRLRHFADQIFAKYPFAAFELRSKAWVVGGRQGPMPLFDGSGSRELAAQ